MRASSNASEEELIRSNSRWLKARAFSFMRKHPSMSISHVDDLYQIGCLTLLIYTRLFPDTRNPRDDSVLAKRIQLMMYDYFCAMSRAVALNRNTFIDEQGNFIGTPLDYAEHFLGTQFEDEAIVRMVVSDHFAGKSPGERRAFGLLMQDCKQKDLQTMLDVNNEAGVSRKITRFRKDLRRCLGFDDKEGV